MSVLYDMNGREIKRGDVLKVYHFTSTRRKKHYMYKQALGVVMLGKDKSKPFLKISHLDMGQDYYTQFVDGRTLDDYEIIQGLDNFEERPISNVTKAGFTH